MKANLNERGGIECIEIIKAPFEVQGVCLFVHYEEDSMCSLGGYYIISEWQTGMKFCSADTEDEIRKAIMNVFERIGVERIKRTIGEAVQEHGVFNEGKGVVNG